MIPATTTDLEARLQGRTLGLSFRYPQSTASGEMLSGVDKVEVWNLELVDIDRESPPILEGPLFERGAGLLATIEGIELESATTGDRIVLFVPISRRDLEESEEATVSAIAEVFAIRTVSPTGESSSFSNQIMLILEPPPASPRGLSAKTRTDGIELSWHTAGDSPIDVYRRRPEERRYREPLMRLEPGIESYLDTGAETGSSYFYSLRALSPRDPKIESEASTEIEVNYRDVFPPEPPAEVIALPETGSVRLLIEPSSSRDVAGYVVYRRDTGADFRRVTPEPVAVSRSGRSEHLDRGLVSGESYVYRVTAIDSASNEGEPGPEVAVTVQ